ncbi:MAG: tetratricopeptide repeat protein [Pyrinomonadaceae bacterium]
MKNFQIGLLTVLTAILSVSAFAQTPTRTASATWQVQKYDLNVTLPQDERSRSMTVKAILNLKNVSSSPAGTLTLRISPFAEVSAVKINDASVDFSKNEEKLTSATSLQRIGVRFASIAPNGVVSATVDYKLTVKDNSSLNTLSPVGSQFLPLSFWYPTPNSWFFTRGGDAAPTRIKVAATGGHSIVSSGAETAGAFEQKLNSQPFFVAGNWETSEQNGIAVFLPKGVSSDGQKRAAELATLMSEARTFVSAILGNAPSTPLRIVASRRGAGFSGGGTVLVDEAVFRRSKVDSLTAMNIAEAVVKMWIGGSTAANGEGYGVITEGLARYIATQFLESKYGKDIVEIERLRQRNSYAAVSKRDAPMAIVSPLDDFYYPEVANKGAMAWRILAKRVGAAEFANIIRTNAQDGELNLAELRAAFSAQKEIVDYFFDQVTDMNLLAGLPQVVGAETRVSLRNTGSIDATVDVVATTANGEKMNSPVTLRATNYGEVAFRTPQKIVRVEIDPEKMYPQIDYSDDVAPRDSSDSDPLLATKRLFDKQDFAGAETQARATLRERPRFDDVRIFLARALLAQNKTVDAEREFIAVLAEQLPTARSIAWANVGLAEIASRNNQVSVALRFAEAAIATDADYGASLAARNVRNKLSGTAAIDPNIKTFFADFDRAATANRKADVDALVMPGEVTRFAGGVAGSTEQWQSQIRAVDRLDANTVLVETGMTIKLLNKEAESGMAVYRLIRSGSGWKLAAVDMFEVR